MALYYITGLSGSGKTTIHMHLKSLGFMAVDGDEGVCNWHSISTGEQVSSPASHTLEWLAKHQWWADRHKIETLAMTASDQPVFLCGTSMNDADFLDLVDDVFFLEMDEVTLRHRLAERSTSNWGKYPDELLHVLLNKQSTEDFYRAWGAHFISATQPVHQVADQILQRCHIPNTGYSSINLANILTE